MEKRDWLTKMRQERKLDQKSMAELIGSSQQFYSYVESGKRRPSPEIAIKIAKVLDFDWTIFYKPVKKIKIQ